MYTEALCCKKKEEAGNCADKKISWSHADLASQPPSPQSIYALIHLSLMYSIQSDSSSFFSFTVIGYIFLETKQYSTLETGTISLVMLPLIPCLSCLVTEIKRILYIGFSTTHTLMEACEWSAS